ncbi:hypothetical protein Pcac1_g9343 [Phytophthora cactorum]|nr:hypothetical protein Pcac1_g9343 [Phytophthora cactorum]
MAAAAETGPSRSDKAAGGAVKDAGAAVGAAAGSATIRRFLWRRVSAAGTADSSASCCVRSCAVTPVLVSGSSAADISANSMQSDDGCVSGARAGLVGGGGASFAEAFLDVDVGKLLLDHSPISTLQEQVRQRKIYTEGVSEIASGSSPRHHSSESYNSGATHLGSRYVITRKTQRDRCENTNIART